MKSSRTIFIKQAKDMFRNSAVLVQFIIFPAVALIMTELIAKSNDDIPNNMFVTIMAAIFCGMALITSTSVIIAEDIERKSLRLLIMAGVKPHEYLIGIGGFILLGGALTSVIFTLIGDFAMVERFKFLTVMIGSITASIILGTILGMMSKNQQAATAISMPIAMILGFTPMIADFNETIERLASVLYTQQLNVIVNDFSANFATAMVIITLNIAVLAILFALVYKKLFKTF